MVSIKLVWLNVWSLLWYRACNLVLLTYDLSSGVKLLEVVDDCVLDVDVSLSEDVCAAGAFGS